MSELTAVTPGGLLHYVIGAFSSPRSRVKELAVDPRLKAIAWQAVLISGAMSALATAVSNYYARNNPGNGTFFLPENSPISEMIFWGGVEFAIILASFLFTLFLWSHLFGYREEKNAVWAAAALSCCPAIILDPLLEVTHFAINDELAYWAIFGAYLLIAVSIAAVYFSAALAIPYMKAAALTLCNLAIFFIAVIAMGVAIATAFTLTSMQSIQ